MNTYVEKDCTVEHEGHKFSSGGAVVTEDAIIAYPGKDGILNDWHGKELGHYRVVSSWPAIFFGHRSWQGDRVYAYRATVDGKTYFLRGFGVGMIAKGRRVKFGTK